jgi:hypothetical protein
VDLGDTLWLQVKRAGKVTGGERDNSIMLRLERELDELADELGVTRPSSLRAWSKATVGYEAIDAILRALQESPQRVRYPPDPSRAHWPDLLLQELTHCAGVLRVAAGDGCPIRFRIVA